MSSDELSQYYKNFKKSLPKTDYTDRTTPHDGIIVVEDTKFFINIKEVSEWSGYLNFRFINEKENCKTIFDRPVVFLSDIKSEEMNDVLNLMYGENETNKDNFSETQLKSFVALSYTLCAPTILNLCKEYINENFEKLDKIKLLDMGCEYDLTEIKTKSLDLINKNLSGYDLIMLLQVAFRHRLDQIKKDIRAEIFALKRKPGAQCCHEFCRSCRRGEAPICPRNQNGELYNPFIFRNIEQIAKLPREIKNYITHSTQ